MPDRIISERVRRSESLDRLTPEAERLHWRMVTVADDYGRLDGRPDVVRADCFKRHDITDHDVGCWLTELEDVGIIVRYMARSQVVIEFVHWAQYQPITDPKPSVYPSREAAAHMNGRRGYGVPRVRARPGARVDIHPPIHTGISTVTTVGSNSRDTVTTPEVTMNGYTGENKIGKGGAGGRIPDVVPHEVRLRPDPPDILLAFDEVLQTHPDYWPTLKFFERVAERFSKVRGLDLEYEAEGMIAWLRQHPKKDRRDIPRFAERWLARAKDDADRQWRRGTPTQGKQAERAGDRWRMGGNVSPEALESADRMAERGRAHYDE